MKEWFKFVKSNVLSFSLLFAFLGLFLLLLLYYLQFGGEPSNSQAVWGAFGDYVGGTINPMLGFLTVIILINTLGVQRKELREARKAIKINNRLVTDQLKVIRSQALEGTFFRLLEDFVRDPVLNDVKERTIYVYFGLYAIERASLRNREAARTFLKFSRDRTIGEFRYVVIEKMASLVMLAEKLENRLVLMQLLKTTVDVSLMSCIVHEARRIDSDIYEVFKRNCEILRGVNRDYVFNDEVAKDFLTEIGLARFYKEKSDRVARDDEIYKKFLEEDDADLDIDSL